MLIYDIIVKCGAPGCAVTKQMKETVARPGEYALPALGRWSGPFEEWKFEQDQPTLCPMHARAKAAEPEEAE